MGLGSSRRYEFEVWTSTGSRIADISHLCQSRSYIRRRNDTEDLSFTVDLNEFEAYCANHLGGANPKTILNPYTTDIKVKRDGQYLFGAQVVDVDFSGDTSEGYTVNIKCRGYLDLFKDRYLSKAYTVTEATAIASDLITVAQAQTYGNVGVTIGDMYSTGVLRDRTYQRDNVKLAIQRLTALEGGNFDFDISWDKVFRTYQQIGARRTDLSFVWGGPLGNVKKFSMDRSALNLFNTVIGLGSGFGTDQLLYSAISTSSATNYYRRERISQYNSVTIQQTLIDQVNAEVFRSRDLLELPEITITSNELVNTFLNPGDRIPLMVSDHPWLDNIDSLYRIEEMEVSIDANDFEEIRLTFDNYGVDQNE